jgi:ABC-type multidrug transport system fused ATPase/permease subunit
LFGSCLFSSQSRRSLSFVCVQYDDDIHASQSICISLHVSDRPAPLRSNTFYITVYGLIGAATAVLMLFRGVTMAFGVVRASSSLHLDMLTSVLRAPSRFFDATPSGRVLNRFSKDVDDVDTFVPMMVRRLQDIDRSFVFISSGGLMLIEYMHGYCNHQRFQM